MTLTVTPIKSEKKSRKFDLFEEICISLSNNKISLQSGDVLVISSKFVSQSQGRIINSDSTVVSDDAKHIAIRDMRDNIEYIPPELIDNE